MTTAAKKKFQLPLTKAKVTIRVLTEQLGTVPKNREIYTCHVADKASALLTEEEIANEAIDIEQLEEKGWTGFFKDGQGIYMQSYMLRGFFKSALETFMNTGACKKVPAYKKWIDKLVFVNPRKVYFIDEETLKPIPTQDGFIERAIRTVTPKGERVALARSDYVNPGRIIQFEVTLLENVKGLTIELLESLFSYGAFVGLGQWRGSGGYGQFELVDFEVTQKGKTPKSPGTKKKTDDTKKDDK